MRLFDPELSHRNALDDGTTTRSFGELEARVARLARVFRDELGLAPGDHAALFMHNAVSYVEVVLAAIGSGVWLTPVNWHLADEEIAYILEDAGAKAVFVDEGTRARLPAAKLRVVGPAELEALVTRADAIALDGNDPPGAPMIYTSGTSGRPKGVKRKKMSTLDAAIAAYRAGGRSFGFDGDGPHLVTGPLYHAAPLLFAIYDLLNGAELVILPRWDERTALATIASRKVRHVHVVPTMCVRLLRLPEDERRAADVSSLTRVFHGAAPIAPDVKRAMLAWWGPKLVEYWGATEGGIYTLCASDEWLAHPGTVGRPVPSYEIVAVDERGARLGPDVIGTLYCRNRSFPDVFEYHGDPEKTASCYLEPGVFTVGDLGHVDAEGYVYLSDRRSNLILTGGVNVYPAEVERVLGGHPAVADVAVFGIPDPEWGESIKAAVELAPGFVASDTLEGELLAYARARLASFKVPRSIDFERSLPRTAAGKLYVRRLRERYVPT